jgi:hypothetical protein
MKYSLRNFLIINILINIKSFLSWYLRNFLSYSPPFIKRMVIKKYSHKNSIFVETGTNRGDNVYNLRKFFLHCFTIEASKYYYKYAFKRIDQIKNISIFYGTSENELEKCILAVIKNFKNKPVTFFLDAHYDGKGTGTFKGNICPISHELKLIKKYIHLMPKVTIIIDDFRTFGRKNYPSKNVLIKFAKYINKDFIIEHDMFICSF